MLDDGSRIKISDITPSKMTEAFLLNTPIQASTIVNEHYIGLLIKTDGIIDSIDVMTSYIAFNFKDKDGVLMSCNFSKPLDKDMSILNLGSKLSLVGQVYNVSKNIVVLDHCRIDTNGGLDDRVQMRDSFDLIQENNVNQYIWLEKPSVKILGVIGTLVGIIWALISFMNWMKS